jgi:hypothetical protein
MMCVSPFAKHRTAFCSATNLDGKQTYLAVDSVILQRESPSLIQLATTKERAFSAWDIRIYPQSDQVTPVVSFVLFGCG